MKNLQEANISINTKVLVRCDLDVPLENGNILETFRLENCLETLNYIISKQGYPIIAGHIGKPQGKEVASLSTKYLQPYFDKHLGKDKYQILENLRFNEGEENNSQEFSESLSKLADIYVNESFATCHRKHASIVGVTNYLPSYAGLSLQREVNNLGKVLISPKKPLTAIIGGAKLESKKPTIDTFLKIADYVLIGGKIGFEWNEEIPSNLILPLDYARDNKDIGSNTIIKYIDIINKSSTIIWAGPLGVYQEDEFFKGTEEIALNISKSTKQGCFSVAGGGDTISALRKAGVLENFSFISSGGGAMLEYLSKGTLPGLEALK